MLLLWLVLAVPQQALPAMGKPTTSSAGGPAATTVSAVPLVLSPSRPILFGTGPVIIQ